jgi:hypothetical protein
MRRSRIRKDSTLTRRETLQGLAALTAAAGAGALAPIGRSSAATGGVVFVPNGSYTATGTWAEGQNIVLGGPGNFGSVGPSLLYYKNFANESPGSRVVNGPDFAAAGLTYAPNGNGYPYCVSGPGLPYGQGMIISNDSRLGNVDAGGGWGGTVITFPRQISEAFTSGTIYFPSSCNYTPIVSAGTPQVKLDWIFANKTGGGGFNDTDLLNGLDNQNISLRYVLQSNAAPGLASNLEVGGNTDWIWGSGPYPKTGVPIRNARWVQLNAPPGSGAGNILWTGVWDGSAQTISAYNNGLVLVAANSAYNGYGIMTAPGFIQYGTGTDPNWSVDNNYYAVQGEIYIAGPSSGNTGAAARVELGDAATYASCSRLSLCLVTSPSHWTASSIQFQLRAGVFYQSLVGLYVYVTTAANGTTMVGQLQASNCPA